MFTGIVQGTGKVLKIVEQTTISTFTIQLPDTENYDRNHCSSHSSGSTEHQMLRINPKVECLNPPK